MGKIVAFVGPQDSDKRIIVRALASKPDFRMVSYVTTARDIPGALPREYQSVLQDQFDVYAGQKKFLLSDKVGSGWSGGNRRAFTRFAIDRALAEPDIGLMLPNPDELACIRDHLACLNRLSSLFVFLVHTPPTEIREGDRVEWYEFVEVGLPIHLLQYEGNPARAADAALEKILPRMHA